MGAGVWGLIGEVSVAMGTQGSEPREGRSGVWGRVGPAYLVAPHIALDGQHQDGGCPGHPHGTSTVDPALLPS